MSLFSVAQVRSAAVDFWDRETPRTAPSERLRSLLLGHHLDCGSGEALSLAVEASWVPASATLLLRLIDSHPRYEVRGTWTGRVAVAAGLIL